MADTSKQWGIPLSDLVGEPLYLVPEQFAARPDLTYSLYDKFLPHAEQIEEYWGWKEEPWHQKDRLLDVSRNFPVDPYFDRFSFDELAKYFFGQVIDNKVSKHFQRSSLGDREERIPPEPYEFVYKLRSCLWHYVDFPPDWNNLVFAYYAIPDYQFGDGFEVRFDHSRSFNHWGQAQHVADQITASTKSLPWNDQLTYYTANVLYLDGVFAYLIYYKGHHVLTISFSVGKRAVFINQIQLRQKKGNRWLYRLPMDLVSYVVDTFYHHFGGWGFEVFLVEGRSLAERISAVHNKKDPLPAHTAQHIERFYNQPLAGYCRRQTTQRQDFIFYRIEPC